MIEALWRLALLSLCCSAALFLSLRLYDQHEQKSASVRRAELLALRRCRLERAVKEKLAWLSSGERIDPQAIIAHLSALRLCRSALDQLMQSAYHPFVRDSAAVMATCDKLEHNRLVFQESKGRYTLVSPVYIEEKDLEKMIEIIENKGAFSPVEIKELDFNKECLLGGELWRVEHLVIGRVDADGALL